MSTFVMCALLGSCFVTMFPLIALEDLLASLHHLAPWTGKAAANAWLKLEQVRKLENARRFTRRLCFGIATVLTVFTAAMYEFNGQQDAITILLTALVMLCAWLFFRTFVHA